MEVSEVLMDLKHTNIWPMTRLWRFQNLRKEAWKWHQRNQAPRNLDKSNKLHLLHKILKILPCMTSKVMTFATNVERNLCFKDISSKSLFLSCLLKDNTKFFFSCFLQCLSVLYKMSIFLLLLKSLKHSRSTLSWSKNASIYSWSSFHVTKWSVLRLWFLNQIWKQDGYVRTQIHWFEAKHL